jgi:hypothetical protein
MRWRYPFTKRFELAGHLWPGVALDYERPPRLAEFGSSPCIVQEVDHRCSEILGIVRCDEFFLVTQREALGADSRRHHGLGHSEGFENFHPRPAARS